MCLTGYYVRTARAKAYIRRSQPTIQCDAKCADAVITLGRSNLDVLSGARAEGEQNFLHSKLRQMDLLRVFNRD